MDDTVPLDCTVSFTFTPEGSEPELPFSTMKHFFTPLLFLIIVSITRVSKLVALAAGAGVLDTLDSLVLGVDRLDVDREEDELDGVVLTVAGALGAGADRDDATGAGFGAMRSGVGLAATTGAGLAATTGAGGGAGVGATTGAGAATGAASVASVGASPASGAVLARAASGSGAGASTFATTGAGAVGLGASTTAVASGMAV